MSKNEYINATDLQDFRDEIMDKFLSLCNYNDFGQLTLVRISETIDEIFDRYCSHPTTDVAEVVRCKDCKHSRPLNKMKSPEKYYKDSCIVCECEDVVGDEPMIYLPTHFCSYGERRTDNDL